MFTNIAARLEQLEQLGEQRALALGRQVVDGERGDDRVVASAGQRVAPAPGRRGRPRTACQRPAQPASCALGARRASARRSRRAPPPRRARRRARARTSRRRREPRSRKRAIGVLVALRAGAGPASSCTSSSGSMRLALGRGTRRRAPSRCQRRRPAARGARSRPLPDVDEVALDRGGGGHLRGDEVGAPAAALAPLEVAVGGRGAALARLRGCRGSCPGTSSSRPRASRSRRRGRPGRGPRPRPAP